MNTINQGASSGEGRAWTPGPWRASGTGAIMATGGHVIALPIDLPLNSKVSAEQKANNSLIAAAPELYEALAAMVEWNIKRGPFDEPLGESEQDAEVNTAVATLRKARGEPCR